MADNYLEKKFAEHNQMPSSRPRTGKQPKVRRVFVTGGANGIGRAIVRSLRVAGNNVAFCDTDQAAGEELARTTGTTFYHTDVRNADELERVLSQLAEKWGDIDAIINNVGICRFAPLEDASVDDFDDVLSVNLRPVFVTGRFMARLRKGQSERNAYGRIVNLCSTRQQMSEAGTEAYSASKGAVFSLTHALAASLAPYGVTVNCISPGWIDTRGEELSPADHAQHFSGRVGTPDDVARLVRFLLAEENNFICAENIVVDGGMTRKMIYI